MKNKTITFLLLLLLVPALVSAQQIKKNISKAHVSLNVTEPTGLAKAFVNPGKTLADGNYMAVDTMNNGLGNMSGSLNPLAFDPYSGTVCFVHRSFTGTYAAGKTSGQLWYNISTDFGVTWSRVPGGINTSNTQMLGRYPSMSIANADKGDISKTTAFFSWPELNPGAFGFLGYAADQPAGSGNPAAFLEQPTLITLYSSDIPSWASDNSPDMFWVAPYGAAPFGIDLFTTPDFGTITKTSPAQWSDSALGSWGQYSMGGASWNGIQHVAVFSAFSATLNPTPLILPGVSKSTDKGATWSNFNVCDFRKIPALSKYKELLTFGGGYNQGDIHVDKNGNVHIVTQVVDTTATGSLAEVALVDLIESTTGSWTATIIATDLDTSASASWNNAAGMGGGQMGPCAYLAFDSTRSIMAVQYINKGTSPYADVFLRYKLVNDATWSAPINMTHSDSTDNSQTHLAPYLRTVTTGSSVECTAFSEYTYEAGVTGPGGANGNESVAYLGTQKFTVTLTGVNDRSNTVNSFALSQNYPNPFNPSTKINYSIPAKSNVSLKVYDMLGREVANLVNATQEAGNHSVNFNASKLASGLYIYTIKSGNNVMSKKMMLLK
jgi:hypothetical protein